MQKRNTALPSSSKMVLRALDPKTCCAIVIDSGGFWVLPTSMHRPRPTVITLSPSEFSMLLEAKAGRSIGIVLKEEAADTILQDLARQIYRDKSLWLGQGGRE